MSLASAARSASPIPSTSMVARARRGHVPVLRRTLLGRYGFAIGGNEEAARLSGVPVARIKVGLYALNGLIVGVAAVVLTGILDSALPNMGTGYELRAIAAVVIGGTPLFGGRGTVVRHARRRAAARPRFQQHEPARRRRELPERRARTDHHRRGAAAAPKLRTEHLAPDPSGPCRCKQGREEEC